MVRLNSLQLLGASIRCPIYDLLRCRRGSNPAPLHDWGAVPICIERALPDLAWSLAAPLQGGHAMEAKTMQPLLAGVANPCRQTLAVKFLPVRFPSVTAAIIARDTIAVQSDASCCRRRLHWPEGL